MLCKFVATGFPPIVQNNTQLIFIGTRMLTIVNSSNLQLYEDISS